MFDGSRSRRTAGRIPARHQDTRTTAPEGRARWRTTKTSHVRRQSRPYACFPPAMRRSPGRRHQPPGIQQYRRDLNRCRAWAPRATRLWISHGPPDSTAQSPGVRAMSTRFPPLTVHGAPRTARIHPRRFVTEEQQASVHSMAAQPGCGPQAAPSRLRSAPRTSRISCRVLRHLPRVSGLLFLPAAVP